MKHCQYITISLLALLLLSLAACGGTPPPPPPTTAPPAAAETPAKEEAAAETPAAVAETPAKEEAAAETPDGAAIIHKMEEAVKATESAHLTVAFQLPTIKGGLDGTLEAWAQRPDKARIEATSSDLQINGSVVGSNAEAGWVYSAFRNTLYTAPAFIGTAHLPGQLEARQVIKMVRKVWDQGSLGEIEATLTGNEEVNGRNCYVVAVVSKDEDDESTLKGISGTFWVDQETYLPQQIELNIVQDDLSGTGLIIVQGEIETGIEIDEAQFTFEPPADATVVSFDAPGPEVAPDAGAGAHPGNIDPQEPGNTQQTE